MVAIGGALDAMVSVDTDGMSPLDLLRDLDTIEMLEAKIAAAKAKRHSSYDRRRAYRPAFRSASTAIAHRRRIGGRAAGREVNLANALHELPAVLDALTAGEISLEHAMQITRLHRQPHLKTAVGEDQDWLIAQASGLAWAEFMFRTENWAEIVDPRDPAELDPGTDKRKLIWANGVGGTALVELTTTTLALEQLIKMLQPTFDLLLEEEWADLRAAAVAQGADPDDVTSSSLPRTDAMRWHDALMIVLRRGSSLLQGDPGTELSVGIAVDLTTLMMAAEAESQRLGGRPSPIGESTPSRDRRVDAAIYRCETTSGRRLAPSLVLWCALATEVRRITLDLDERTTSISHKGRFFNDGQRAAMLVRDRHCRGPGCCRFGSLQADHIEPANRGGLTHTKNGNMLCGPCHRHKTWLQAMGFWHTVEHLWNPNDQRHIDAHSREIQLFT